MSGTRLNEPDGIDENVTTLHIYANSALPLAPFHLTFESGETVKVTAGGPRVDTLTVERGALGTTRVGHSNGERLIVSVDREVTLALESSGSSLPGVTSGPIPAPLAGVTIDPTYDPTHTYVSGDLASGASWYGASLVHFETWTPTESGTLYLVAPLDDGASYEIDFYLFQGSTPGVDVPGRDGTGTQTRLGSAYLLTNTVSPRDVKRAFNSFSVVAGTTYTMAATLFVEGYGDPTAAIGTVLHLSPWILSTQVLGGQSSPVRFLPDASGDGAMASGYGTVASGRRSHASGYATEASGNGSESFGLFSVASGEGSLAGGFADERQNGCRATGDSAVALGRDSLASGAQAVAIGESCTASGAQSRATGSLTTASGDQSEASGSVTQALGLYSRAEGHESVAVADLSFAGGWGARAALMGEYAHGSNYLVAVGDAQYTRLESSRITPDATPLGLRFQFHDEIAPLGTNQTWQVIVQIAASRHDTPGTVAGWRLSGLLTSCGTPRVVGSTDTAHWADAAASGWAVAMSVDGSGNLVITVTGEAGQSIYWHAVVHASRVGV